MTAIALLFGIVVTVLSFAADMTQGGHRAIIAAGCTVCAVVLVKRGR